MFHLPMGIPRTAVIPCRIVIAYIQGFYNKQVFNTQIFIECENTEEGSPTFFR
jgi:hypothetical protein